MAVFRRLVFVAVCAGTIAGLFSTVLHHFTTVPLILAAEAYENAASDLAHTTDHSPAWEPSNGLERLGATAIADVLTGIAFALILVAIWRAGDLSLNAQRGALWGLAGFTAVILAPSLGLPPELPGTQAAALSARQLWWVATVIATAVGLGGLCFAKSTALRVAAIAIIVLPQVIGAPQPLHHGSLAPAELAAQFHLAVIASSFGFWIVLGALCGRFIEISRE
jgi:cobalt transporter subunit CbtA